MTNATQPRTWVRAVNTLVAVALAAFVLANYWPIVKVFDLSRADLQYQGEWIGGHAKRITAVTPGGFAVAWVDRSVMPRQWSVVATCGGAESLTNHASLRP